MPVYGLSPEKIAELYNRPLIFSAGHTYLFEDTFISPHYDTTKINNPASYMHENYRIDTQKFTFHNPIFNIVITSTHIPISLHNHNPKYILDGEFVTDGNRIFYSKDGVVFVSKLEDYSIADDENLLSGELIRRIETRKKPTDYRETRLRSADVIRPNNKNSTYEDVTAKKVAYERSIDELYQIYAEARAHSDTQSALLNSKKIILNRSADNISREKIIWNDAVDEKGLGSNKNDHESEVDSLEQEMSKLRRTLYLEHSESDVNRYRYELLKKKYPRKMRRLLRKTLHLHEVHL